MKKKSIKMFISAFAVCAVSAMAVMFSGCSVKDTLNQLKCKHEYGEIVVIEESTCVEKGKGEKTCSKCERVKEVELDLAEHVLIVTEAVPSTCVKTGLTSGTKCSVCDTIVTAQQEIPALGHIVVKDKAVEATCLMEGLKEGEHCSRCNEVLTKQEKIPANGHNLVILEAVAPTCSEEGLTQGVWCAVCEEVFTTQEVVPALGHTDNNADDLCDICGIGKKVVTQEIAVVDGEVVAGNWYRIYRPINNAGASQVYVTYNLSNAPTVSIEGKDWPYTQDLKLCAHYVGYNIRGYVYGPGPMGYLLEDIQCVIEDDYIDICFEVGVYNIIANDNAVGTAEITEESTISLGTYPDNIKRLVKSVIWADE